MVARKIVIVTKPKRNIGIPKLLSSNIVEKEFLSTNSLYWSLWTLIHLSFGLRIQNPPLHYYCSTFDLYIDYIILFIYYDNNMKFSIEI